MSVAVSELPNGLRVVTHTMRHLETVSMGIWVGAGSRFEAPLQHGISHLLEHMAFKGTTTRSARDIVEEIEFVGGELNAATSLDSTAYYARVLKGDEELALGLLADILRNPVFDAGELVREKDVILQEIAASRDSPDDLVYDLAQETAFSDQAIGRSILGTPSSVRGLGADDLVRYLGVNYTPGAMVLSAAGAVDHDRMVELARSLFGDAPRADAVAPQPARYTGGVSQGKKQYEQDHVILAFRGPSYNEDEFYAAQVLSGILGGGMSSRLFQEAREKRGLCYAVYSFCWGLSDAGLFGVHAATGEQQLSELVNVICSQFEQSAEIAPDHTEISRAKAQIKTGLLTSLENSGARAEQLARQVLAFGRPLDTGELIEKVEAVNGEKLRTVAEKLLHQVRPTMALVGTIRESAEVESLMRNIQTPAVEAAE